MLTCLCLTHCMASFLYQNLKTCSERLHSTRTKLLHPRNTTYGWPNSHRKLYSRDWLIWNKMALQLQQRTPHWQLSYRKIMIHNLSCNFCWHCFTSSFNANLNILKQLEACTNKVFCKHCSNIVTHFLHTLLDVLALLHIWKHTHANHYSAPILH